MVMLYPAVREHLLYNPGASSAPTRLHGFRATRAAESEAAVGWRANGSARAGGDRAVAKRERAPTVAQWSTRSIRESSGNLQLGLHVHECWSSAISDLLDSHLHGPRACRGDGRLKATEDLELMVKRNSNRKSTGWPHLPRDPGI